MTCVDRAKRRSLGDDLKASGGKMVKMGSGELTRLWNICPDNMAACCRNDKSVLAPGLRGRLISSQS